MIRTEWDLSPLYTSIDDPQIQKDLDKSKRAYIQFKKKYKEHKNYLSHEKELYGAITEYEKLRELPLAKISYYFHYKTALNSTDDSIRARTSLLDEQITHISNEILFFEVELSHIDKKIQKKFLSSHILKPYKYFLSRVFINSPYMLSEKEEKVISLLSQPAYSLWVDATEKALGTLRIPHQGDYISYAEASQLVLRLPTQEKRQELQKSINEALTSVASLAEGEMNAICTTKKIQDQLRGEKKPYSGTVRSYENDEQMVNSLLTAVVNNNSISHDFYALKKSILKLPTLYYSDRTVSIGSVDKKFSFEDSLSSLRSVFGSVDSEFESILNRLVESGQVDVYPKQGKRGGAFCAHHTNQPTFVFLNHTDDLHSHMTFAHEMGHAIHSEFSRTQRPLYDDYSTSTAEVASTLFETFVFEDMYEKMSPEEKIVALHDRINDDVQTIFRQVAFFNCELEIHESVRTKGYLSRAELAQIFKKHISAYLGPSVSVTDEDAYQFVSIPHFRYYFYVYTYALGQLISKVLYKKYKENPAYIKKIKQFLSAGGSDTPQHIFKAIGVDMSKKEIFEEGLQSIKGDIERLRKLIKK